MTLAGVVEPHWFLVSLGMHFGVTRHGCWLKTGRLNDLCCQFHQTEAGPISQAHRDSPASRLLVPTSGRMTVRHARLPSLSLHHDLTSGPNTRTSSLFELADVHDRELHVSLIVSNRHRLATVGNACGRLARRRLDKLARRCGESDGFLA